MCGPHKASSLMVSVPLLAPPAVGVNVTLMEQVAPPGRLAPQLLVCWKSPLVEMLVMVKGAAPVLRTFTVFGALVVPTG